MQNFRGGALIGYNHDDDRIRIFLLGVQELRALAAIAVAAEHPPFPFSSTGCSPETC
jgi:hypothetical protein